MPEVCAAIGLGQLVKINELIEKRIKIAELYAQEVKHCEWLIPQKVPQGISHMYWSFVMKLTLIKKYYMVKIS